VLIVEVERHGYQIVWVTDCHLVLSSWRDCDAQDWLTWNLSCQKSVHFKTRQFESYGIASDARVGLGIRI
jgi:hypothetical protein